MSKLKHTPGPWVAETIQGIADVYPVSVNAFGGVRPICDFPRMTSEAVAQQMADATLVAAAPEMYALLRDARDAAMRDDDAVALANTMRAIDALLRRLGDE